MDIIHEKDNIITWDSLLIELKKECFNILEPNALITCSLVNKEFNRLASNEQLWKRHYGLIWESIGLEKFPNEPSYKKMFLRRLKRTDHRIMRFKCRVANVLIVGDEKTAKTSLIEGIKDEFTKSVLETKTPEEKLRMQNVDPNRTSFKKTISYGMVNQANCLLKFIDAQYQRGDEEEKYLDTIRDQLLDCDAIILTYDVTKMETLERLRDFWLPFIRRFCPREIPSIVVGTKTDLLVGGLFPQEVADLFYSIKRHSQVELAINCSPLSGVGCINVLDYVGVVIISPMVSISDATRQHYKPYVQQFLHRVFDFYDTDKDGFLTADEFLKCYNETVYAQHESSIVIQNHVFAARPDLCREDGKISKTAFMYWLELCLRGGEGYVWSLLSLFGFRLLFYTSLYPPNLQLRGASLQRLLQRPPKRGHRAVTVLPDMRRIFHERNHDEEVKYWLACSYCGITVTAESRDIVAKTAPFPEQKILTELLMEKNPLTACMAAKAISHFLEDKHHRPKFITDKTILTERLVELLSMMDLDPVLLEGYSRPFVGLSNDADVQSQLIDIGFVKVVRKLLHIDFPDLQYNIGQVVYNMLTHRRRKEFLTDEVIDSIALLMQSPLPALILTGLHCSCAAIACSDSFEILIAKKSTHIFEGVFTLSMNDQYKFYHPATVALSTFTRNESLRETIIERKIYGAFFRLLREVPVTNCLPSSVTQIYDGIRNLTKSERFYDTVDIDSLFTAMLTSKSAPQATINQYNFMQFFIELAAARPSFASSLIKVLEKELTSCPPPVSLKYLQVIQVLAYFMVHFNDLAMYGKDTSNLINAGFIKFIKNQLKAFKSTKAVIPLLDALGILATKHNVKDDELSGIFEELLNNESLMKEIDVKFVLEWCMDKVDSTGKPVQFPTGVYLTIDEFAGDPTKLSRDRLSVRLDIETFGTVAANLPVTEGKWYYEVTLFSDGIMKIGWATLQTLRISKGSTVGDDFSYGVDLNRNKAFNGQDKPYGNVKWKAGDILGCYLDLDKGQILFSLNGVQQGVAFENVVASDGLFPALTMANGQQVRFNFGAEPFAHALTGGFKPYNLVL